MYDFRIYEYLKHLLTVLPEHENDTDSDYLDALMPWSKELPDGCMKPLKPDKKKNSKPNGSGSDIIDFNDL